MTTIGDLFSMENIISEKYSLLYQESDYPITDIVHCLSNDHTNIDRVANDRESGSTNNLHEYKDYRKSYPQRNNRTKLNYRDLERGMYEKIRQTIWALNNPTFINANNKNEKTNKRCCDDDDDDVINLSTDEDETTNDDNDQFHRRLWCICHKPWDHSRLMLRCDSCANWYHGDCIGVTKEDAKTLDINGLQFICPPCQGQNDSDSMIESAESSDDPVPTKRKRSEDRLQTSNLGVRENKILLKSISHDESRKQSKTDVSFRRNSLPESKVVDCIVHGCKYLAKPNWVYCSSTCIRRHINDTLQAIQRSKGKDNEEIPTRGDILLYESKSKKILEKNLVPKIEDLSTWINQHPSYEIMKSSLQQTIILRDNQSTNLSRSLSCGVNTTKSKFSSKPITNNQQTITKSILNKKTPIQLTRRLNNTISNMNNTVDIRSKVPTALYDKILMRLEKNGEKDFIKEDIRLIVHKIEEEMFHVYGKIDNPYKNKFRSLIANISNMNNNYFYKKILSKDLTAKQIVAMKPEDMLPPEEKEKRKDQFEKEVQRIINAEQQTAEEMARRAGIKVTRQDLINNDKFSPLSTLEEQNSSKEKVDSDKDNQSTNIAKESIEIKLTTTESIDETSKSIILTTDEKSTTNFGSDNQTFSSTLSEDLSSISVTKEINSNEPSILQSQHSIHEQSDPIFSAVDLDNDYIEPESPTGIDALIYDDNDDDDDDDNDNGLNNINKSSCSSTNPSSNDNTEYNMPYQPIIRDDYNPSKIQNETSSICQPKSITHLPNQWRGIIHPSDIKIPCQSVHVYGESDYLIENIPEQLIILGRLRLGDLWDYIRESLTVRDILILTLISSSTNTNDNELFSKYVDTLDTSGRAAVISKCVSSSLIRDMYILAANTKDCPSNVLSSLFLPITFESKQLFLVIIGSGKRTMKLINRSNENSSMNNLIYNPIALQDSTVIRDPRLLKTKDPRLNRYNTTNENVTLSTSQPSTNIQQTSVQYSNEDLHKLLFDSLERIRHSLKSDDIRSIVMSTMKILKANERDDLCKHFNDNLRIVMIEWQTKQGSTSIVVDDNLIEENMDVDDDQDDKNKKQITTSSTSNISSEFNDVDYRFLDQDMHHHMKTTTTTTAVEDDSHRKQRRKSRFSDRLPIDDNHTIKVKSNIQIDKFCSKEEPTKITSSKTVDKHINSSLNSKFRPIINSSESFIPLTNIKDKLTSKPIRFSFSKDSLRRHKTNISLTNNNDIYESSPKFIEDLIKQVQSYGYQGLSLSNDNWIKQTLPITPIRSTAMLNLVMQQQQQQQQKTNNRFSSYTNEWRSSSNNNYMTHYYDFDQPQE
ncbi:unnamed protein product [Rotaria sordida]|uniref:Transcription factor BYE1 n=1 Tax=Rotaria sordida TaxID=392033 RepID=A0A814X0Y5_9BILA|nr:unnamed protein product [Rotaria sordida]